MLWLLGKYRQIYVKIVTESEYHYTVLKEIYLHYSFSKLLYIDRTNFFF